MTEQTKSLLEIALAAYNRWLELGDSGKAAEWADEVHRLMKKKAAEEAARQEAERTEALLNDFNYVGSRHHY